jgi:hypothetical protein
LSLRHQAGLARHRYVKSERTITLAAAWAKGKRKLPLNGLADPAADGCGLHHGSAWALPSGWWGLRPH